MAIPGNGLTGDGHRFVFEQREGRVGGEGRYNRRLLSAEWTAACAQWALTSRSTAAVTLPVQLRTVQQTISASFLTTNAPLARSSPLHFRAPVYGVGQNSAATDSYGTILSNLNRFYHCKIPR